MARLNSVTFDALHAGTLARFWAAALDGYAVAPYNDAEIEKLRASGSMEPAVLDLADVVL